MLCFFLSVSPFLWKPITFFAKPHPRLAAADHHHRKQKINKTTCWHHHSYNDYHYHHHPQPWPPTTKIITKSQTQTHNLITIHHQQLEKEKEKQPSKITTKSQIHNLITTNNWKRKKKNNHRERPTRSKTHAELLADDPRRSTLNADAHAGQRPMNLDLQNQITPPSSSASKSAVTLWRQKASIIQWCLGFEVLTNEPWKGGAQIVKSREIEATGKERRGKRERREKKEEKNKIK